VDKNNKGLHTQISEKYNLMPGVLSCYGYSWRQIWRYFLELFVILIVAYFMYNMVGIFLIPLQFIGFFLEESNSIFFILLFFVLAFIFSLLYIIFWIRPVTFGVDYAYLKASRGEKLIIRDMFAFLRDYWNVVIAGLLTTLIVALGTLFLIIPGIIFACKLIFVPYIVMDRKMKATDAIKESWMMTNGYAWKVFLMILLGIPIIIAGYICLIYGSIISVIWINLAFASLYYAVYKKRETKGN
jgi:hypothetical protein